MFFDTLHPLACERRHHAGAQILGTCLARASRPGKRLDMCGVLLYHAASARLPCGRLRCWNTRRSDRSTLSIPPLTAHMANNGGKRPCSAALYRLRLSLLSIRCTRRRQAVKDSTIRRLAALCSQLLHYTASRSLVCLGAVLDGL